MAVQVPGPAQDPDLDLALALAAGAETTSSKVLPRYRNIFVGCCLLAHMCHPLQQQLYVKKKNRVCFKPNMWAFAFLCAVCRMETEMAPLTSLGQTYGLLTQWTLVGMYLAVSHTYYVVLSTGSGFQTYTILPKVFAHLPLHSYELKLHPILNP